MNIVRVSGCTVHAWCAGSCLLEKRPNSRANTNPNTMLLSSQVGDMIDAAHLDSASFLPFVHMM